MKKKEFKSESKRLLDLMINSIYTNKDIYLRELISNASDALDKLYYRSLTDKDVKVKKKDLEINIKVDKNNCTITISDNGCGMTKDELENNLGTIAKSGSLAFKEMQDKRNKNIDIIGQFGVGFYSAFMVSDNIKVISKSINSEDSYSWESSGVDGYTITNAKKEKNGTDIILHIKEDNEDNNYSEYLDEYKIKSLVKKYSDYIKYPIKMELEKVDDKGKSKKEFQILNSMIPIWKRNKKDVNDEDYNNYYKDTFVDYENPLKVISSKAEGMCSYESLLFIPSHAPYDYYTKEYEKGLSLYSNGVLIMDKCSDLLPDYFSFVKGIVDSEDLPLNISREMLQKTKNLNIIAKNIELKIKKELENLLTEDREKYKEFFKNFGIQIKVGVYNNYGANKDKLKDLLMFYSAKTKDLITLREYVDNMKEDQKSIYFASGETVDKIDELPQLEQVTSKDYDVLYLTDYVDEFTLNMLSEYDGKKFMNVSNEKLDIDDENKEIAQTNESFKEMLNLMKESINDVSEVRFTNKLKKHPVCLTTKGEVSLEMEKVLNSMPMDNKIKAESVLEINDSHPISKKIKDLYKKDKEELKKYAKILYSEARFIEGLSIENPTEISNLICEVISK